MFFLLLSLTYSSRYSALHFISLSYMLLFHFSVLVHKIPLCVFSKFSVYSHQFINILSGFIFFNCCVLCVAVNINMKESMEFYLLSCKYISSNNIYLLILYPGFYLQFLRNSSRFSSLVKTSTNSD